MAKRLVKSLLIAKIKAREKVKPHTWTSKGSSWGQRAHKATGGAVDDWVSPTQDTDDWISSDKTVSEPHTKDFSWGQAITDIPHEIAQDASKGLSNLTSAPEPGAAGAIKNLAKTASGAAGLVFSPATGLYHSVLGHTMANLEHEGSQGIDYIKSLFPGEHTYLSDTQDPEAVYNAAKGDVDTAMAALPANKIIPGSATPVPPISPVSAGSDVVSAAQRASQVAPNPINVPRAFASDNVAVQRAGQMARNVPIVGDSIPKATGEMADQMGDAVSAIASHYGEGSGPNVANRIGRGIGEGAEAETAATTNAARASDDALLADWQRAHEGATAQVDQAETNALTHARQLTGDMSPQDMGQALITRLRSGEQEARALKDQLYASAGESDASVRADSVQGVHNRVSAALDDAGRVVDPDLTPAANRMMNELQNFSQLRIPNRVGAPPPDPATITAVDARGMEQVRKRLNGISDAANNDADRAASRLIMRQFDAWQADAYNTALFSGSPEALQAFRDARTANASWRQRFYNDRDDADKIINKVVTGEVTPQEMSNWMVGASQVGSKGVSSRMLTRLGEVTGHDPQAMEAIRGGVANRLFGTTEGVSAKNPEKVANDIHEFFNGSGRDVAQRLYTPQQRQAALDYASTLHRGQEARQTIADVAKTTKPSPMQVGPGPMQELATSILGKNGKSDEALFNAIDSYARSGGRADVQTLSDIVKNIPEKDRGDLAGAIIRKLGYSDQAKGFSPEKFATEWEKYTPQAKSVLFGNAGAHRQALDDIATISQRYKEVGRRFGNPSGTAQNVTGAGLLSAIWFHPLVAIPSLISGAVFAKMLSAPASAVKTANFLKSSLAMAKAPTAQKMTVLTGAANNFAKAAEKLGSNISAPEFVRQLQGPVPANANGEQPNSKRVGQ